jgi:ABC-2 type transport system ATP-binding protein
MSSTLAPGLAFSVSVAARKITLAALLRAPVQEAADPVLLTATVPAVPSRRPPSEQAATAVAELGRAGITVGEFALGQPSLDEVFLALTSQPAAAHAPSSLTATEAPS